MSKLFFLILSLLILSNCSLDKSTHFLKKKQKIEVKKNFKKVFSQKVKNLKEFNPNLKLDLSKISSKNKIEINKNNNGSQIYSGSFDKIGSYKFSKLDNFNQYDYRPIFLKDGIIFFDKKGSIIRYDINQKVLWKKNYYSKNEKKLKPKLNFFLKNNNLLLVDNIAKFYSINVATGELNWIKNNIYPANSEIKEINNKIYFVDYNNTLRCFDIVNGSEIWSLKTEDTFSLSNLKNSLIIDSGLIVFSNSIGDISAADIKDGIILWVLPTQNLSSSSEAYNLKISSIVSDGKQIFFSTNVDKFYSVNIKMGVINWTNEINSNLKPILIDNFIFTVSNEGYLYVLDKIKGNILRITDLYKDIELKKRNKIRPTGFVVGNKNLYLTNSDGTLLVADLEEGNILNLKKISRSLIPKPFIFNESLYLVTNGSIIQYN